MIKKILLSIALFGLVFFLLLNSGSYSMGSSIFFGYVAMSIPWGWSATGRWFSTRFSFQMGAIDIMLLGVRMALSTVLGFILFPIEVIRLIFSGIKAKKTIPGNSQDNVNSNQ
jgi:hypothetical protein